MLRGIHEELTGGSVDHPGPAFDPLTLDRRTRDRLWGLLAEAAEGFADNVGELAAGALVDASDVRKALAAFDFDDPVAPTDAFTLALDALRTLQPQVGHPRHFGMFDPAPTTMGIIADALAALFNPCLATWDGSPFGVETERHLVASFAGKFGYPQDVADGIITSGGSEANLTAALLALVERFPEYPELGLRGLPGQPVIYFATGAHPSVPKAARLVGLGDSAAREVPVTETGRMDGELLDRLIQADRDAGLIPLLVSATAGTTGEGVIDPIGVIAEVATRHGVWLHVDAAWGGAAALLPELRSAFADMEQADSITFDPHKWMSVPMNCGMLLTRHGPLLGRAFDVTAPFVAAQEGSAPDPFARSIRWSRGFAGLKLLLSLAVAGWSGYEETLRRQVALGNVLRARLRAAGWSVTNDTPLPVVCFTDERRGADEERRFLSLVAGAVNRTGEAKLFVAKVRGRHALRACLTNHATRAGDVDRLVDLLESARQQVLAGDADLQAPVSAGDCTDGACSTGFSFAWDR
ncbi:pyridoxal phosphate-dependent decarboxylase family protein [Actinomadura sp. 9N215]|uniref:pyridoxal phosphate-dependent decarboxylase family protein n=1 Tax=Actinomadura sp. 9N215 TaxID=3375150 RepID=UPI0037B01E8B